jgi:glycosyltransferase involved in cell wall biosynthesis
MILAVSEYERDAALARRIGSGDRFRVVHNGVDTASFRLPRTTNCGRVVMVGRLVTVKRTLLAVQAMGRLRSVSPSAHLLIAGEGPLRKELEKAVRRANLTSCVFILGNVEAIPKLLASAACLLLTSTYEGFPLAIVEAMAAGLPVVTTRFGGATEAVVEGATGLVVDAHPAAIAEALHRVLADTELAERMGAAGRARACARFDSIRMADCIVDLYDEVAGSPSPLESPATLRNLN